MQVRETGGGGDRTNRHKCSNKCGGRFPCFALRKKLRPQLQNTIHLLAETSKRSRLYSKAGKQGVGGAL
jgi:hypothetical protein